MFLISANKRFHSFRTGDLIELGWSDRVQRIAGFILTGWMSIAVLPERTCNVGLCRDVTLRDVSAFSRAHRVTRVSSSVNPWPLTPELCTMTYPRLTVYRSCECYRKKKVCLLVFCLKAHRHYSGYLCRELINKTDKTCWKRFETHHLYEQFRWTQMKLMLTVKMWVRFLEFR